MPREKKYFQNLHPVDYDIAGNVFRAWKDDSDELIFVLDETIDEFKPNALLVLTDHGERKWDDILTNDYGIDLEDVRPRLDNKYQKLDIEYMGLDVYAQLIDRYERGDDLDSVIADLIDFRDTAARRAAVSRLAAANEIIAQAEDTIRRAERAKNGLRDRRRSLRAKLAKQKEYIGREPTKQSASRILKTESQMDTITEKLARAEKRIENANRRIQIATEDANAARDLLARRRIVDVVVDNKDKADTTATLPTKRKAQSKKIKTIEPQAPEDTKDTEKDGMSYFPVPEYEYQSQPRDEKMSDSEEVKPLLDEDPEILDEEIAFKPVEFDDIKPRVQENKREYSEPKDDTPKQSSDTVARPLAFSNAEENSAKNESYQEDIEIHEEETPVIDTIKNVEEPSVSDTDTTGRTSNMQYDNTETIRPATPVQNVSPAPNGYVRPISPITGNNTPVRPVGEEHSRPSLAYSLLLILLIVLSIFTLWLYQKKNGGMVPFLNASTKGMVETPQENTNATIGFDEDSVIESVSLPIVTPEPVVEPTPVVAEPEPIPEPQVQDEPIKIEYPNENILRGPEPEVQYVESEEDVLARKGAYDVAREDRPIYSPEPRVTNIVAPDVIFDDDVISVPVVPADYSDEDMYYQDESAYYQNEGVYYDNNAAYQEYVDENRAESREPRVERHLSVHDGGQYSIGYTETTY